RRSRRRGGAAGAAPGPHPGDRGRLRRGVGSRADQGLALYRSGRLGGQLRYYEAPRTQVERAGGPLLLLSAVLLGATSTVSALAGAPIEGTLVWAALAAILPAVSTALVAYGALFGFERYAKLYADAARNLGLLEALDLSGLAEEEADAEVTKF